MDNGELRLPGADQRSERGALSFERESLVDLSASVAARSEPALARALRIACATASADVIEEVLLQSHLFVGFPLALEALILWRDLAPDQEPASAYEDHEIWKARGEEVCRTTYGHNYEKLRENVRRLHPDLDEWMVTGGYGRVIGRPGLDLATRELCTVALLAVWGAPRQLHSHLRGAVHAGAAISEVRAAIEIAGRHLTPSQLSEVRDLVALVLGDRDGG